MLVILCSLTWPAVRNACDCWFVCSACALTTKPTPAPTPTCCLFIVAPPTLMCIIRLQRCSCLKHAFKSQWHRKGVSMLYRRVCLLVCVLHLSHTGVWGVPDRDLKGVWQVWVAWRHQKGPENGRGGQPEGKSPECITCCCCTIGAAGMDCLDAFQHPSRRHFVKYRVVTHLLCLPRHRTFLSGARSISAGSSARHSFYWSTRIPHLSFLLPSPDRVQGTLSTESHIYLTFSYSLPSPDSSARHSV